MVGQTIVTSNLNVFDDAVVLVRNYSDPTKRRYRTNVLQIVDVHIAVGRIIGHAS